jgi:hypothetical protein
MNPAAVDKARSLYHFAQSQGALLETFLLVLTEKEACELVNWYASEYAGNAEFDLDISIARKTENPWHVLNNFKLMGMDMVPLMTLN